MQWDSCYTIGGRKCPVRRTSRSMQHLWNARHGWYQLLGQVGCRRRLQRIGLPERRWVVITSKNNRTPRVFSRTWYWINIWISCSKACTHEFFLEQSAHEIEWTYTSTSVVWRLLTKVLIMTERMLHSHLWLHERWKLWKSSSCFLHKWLTLCNMITHLCYVISSTKILLIRRRWYEPGRETMSSIPG